jgi:hypothetical protein
VDEGVLLLRTAVEAQIATGHRYGLAWLVGMLAEGLLLGGRHDEAAEEARRGMSLAVECGEQRAQAEIHRLHGEIAAGREPPSPDLAEEQYRQGLELASELGARPLVAHCHLGLGKLYRHTGKGVQAQEHLATATTMYREMDMRFWLEQAEAELKELET